MRYWTALSESVGGKWFFLPSFLSGTIALYDRFREWGINPLPELSGWTIAFLAILPISLWSIIGLLRKVVLLEKKLEPKLTMELVEHKSNSFRKWYVKITNPSMQTIRKCKVIVIELENLPFNYRPTSEIPLVWETGTGKDQEGAISIRPEQSENCAVIRLEEDRSDVPIYFGFQLDNYKTVPRDCRFSLTIKAHADDIKPTTQKYNVCVDDGCLVMRLDNGNR